MPSVTYDEGGFVVDGKRIWLISGSIHYFRTPSALWHDRLLKAKRAGLNCVSTYIAWNYHEMQEGKWDLTGDRDLVAFVRMAGELGLYVILRPGPYICAEWDFGGLPAWLTAKAGIAYRTSNAAYMHYFDKYFRQILSRLAEFQITRGGNIILIQNENEYFMTAAPDRLNYLEFINQLFRRSGFDIPVVNCNCFSDPPVPDTVEAVNAWSNVVQQLKRLRLRQPKSPLIVTEYWAGWFDSWGSPHQTRDDQEVARRALEIVGCGAQLNYYMWHGGTNFAFWGSRLSESHESYQTTSYDYDAPLAEGGGLTRKYYLTRLVNMLANHMGSYLAGAAMRDPGVSVHDSTSTLNISGPQGRWAVVTNNGRADIVRARISLPNARELDVSLKALGATAVPVSVRLGPTLLLDYSNLMPLGYFAPNVLVLHGEPLWPGVFSINGAETRCEVPVGDEVKLIEGEAVKVVVINSDLAMRTWAVEDSLIFGPQFVGQTAQDVILPAQSPKYTVLSADGKLNPVKAAASASGKARLEPPGIGKWVRRSVCTEPVAKEMEWHKLDRPRDLDRLGVNYGYAWYRCDIVEDRPRRRELFLSDCEDRAILFLNGNLIGTWGRGEGAVRTPIVAELAKGVNVLTVLADNLGRPNFGSRLGELKGLYGDIYDARPIAIRKVKVKSDAEFNRRSVPRHLCHLLGELEAGPITELEVELPLPAIMPVHLSFTGLPCHAAIFCNGRSTGFFPRLGKNYGDVTLGPELRKGKNAISIFLWDRATPKIMEQFKLHALQTNLTESAAWGWRPWTMPVAHGPIVGKDQPAWYSANFPYTRPGEPLFLHIIGARKGQIFINGQNAGRFWTVGPQQYYYLPECWLKEDNELLLFEEQGRIPAGSSLIFRPGGPYRE